jgi:FAD/FMN-containing dehydrogenase
MRRRTIVISSVAGTALAVLNRMLSRPPGPDSWHANISSHVAFEHDSIDALGYDWGRIADPAVPPRYPKKIYLPQTADDVARMVIETKRLGERLAVRAKGHSSNNLVLTDGSVLLTEKLDRVLALDRERQTVTVQAGIVLATLDDYLWKHGLGLPVIGDHNHITAGGFASVGGFGPAAHRYGLFVDTVLALEYVTWDGEIRNCSRDDDPGVFFRLLTGQGRYGIITALTVKVIAIDKYRTIVRNDRTNYYRFERFVTAAESALRDPGDALYMRALWLYGPAVPGKYISIGSIQLHRATTQAWWKSLRNRVNHAYLHSLGLLSGRLPASLEQVVEGLGAQGLFFAPRYATVKNLERFLDQVIDYSGSDPNRFVIIWTPIDAWAPLFREVYALMMDFKKRYACFTFITADNGTIRSDYLAHGDPALATYVHMFFELGIDLGAIDDEIFDDFISRIDDLCIAHGAYRYMHTRTVDDPERRARVDPNTYYADRYAPVATEPTQHENGDRPQPARSGRRRKGAAQ